MVGMMVLIMTHHLGALIRVAAEGGGSEREARRREPINTPNRGVRDQAHQPRAQKGRLIIIIMHHGS